jgi:anti-sigma B factor antagonist
MDLRLRSRAVDGAMVLEVSGEVDLHCAPQLRAELVRVTEVPSPQIVVDLAGVSFIDSTGIGVLVGGLKKARERSGEIAFCSPQTRVKRVFEITGLLQALPLFETRLQALNALQAKEKAASVKGSSEENN